MNISRQSFATVVRRTVIGLVGALLLIQLVPYGRNHVNPSPIQEPQWLNQELRDITRRACFDCHSNETFWPWYSNIAPGSWLMQHDVTDGRRHLNFSEWNRPQRDARKSAAEVAEGEMPPWFYVILHPNARLSSAEKQMLIDGFSEMFGGETRE